MPRIADLYTAVRAPDKQLKRDFRKIDRAWYQFGQRLNRTFGSTLRGLGSATTAALTAAIAAGARQGLQLADSLAKEARSVGFTAEEYQRLAYSYDLAGLAQSNLLKQSATLSRAIYDFSRGLSTQRDAFAALNIEYGQLQRLNPSEQLLLVLDALREVEDEYLRNALAQTILGRSGKELGTILAQSSREIRAQGAELERLGAVFTQRELGEIENFNDELNTLGRVIHVNFIRGIQRAIPEGLNLANIAGIIGNAIRDATSLMIDFGRVLYDHRGLILNIARAWLAWKAILLSQALITGIRALTLTFVGLARAIFSVQALIYLPFVAVLAAVITVIGAVADESNQLGQTLVGTWRFVVDLFSKGMAAISEHLGPIAAQVFGGFVNIVRAVVNAIYVSFREMYLLFIGLPDQLSYVIFGSVREFLRGVDALLVGGLKALASFGNQVIKIQNVLRRLNGQSLIPLFDLNLIESPLAKQITALDSVVKGIGRRTQEARDEFDTLFGSVISGFGNFIDEVKQFFAGLGSDIGSGFLNGLDIIQSKFLEFLQSLKSRYEQVGGELTDALGANGTSIGLPGLSSTDETPKTDGRDLGKELVDSLNSGVQAALEGGSLDDAGDALVEGVRKAVTQSAAENLTQGLLNVFGKLWQSLVASFNRPSAQGLFDFGSIVPLSGVAHEGGFISGVRGQEKLILAQAGEAILTPQQLAALAGGGSGTTVNLYANNSDADIERTVYRMAARGVFDGTSRSRARERVA